ncbi:fungal-specific transcription factor domain-containing protein [Auriculariales sp. MPI-PUGE-AT-0066]|nr:fungal-specific transcription factor domain-containing protein [Auriculariales sp. MPI-PUGE-AT-0066]
MTKPVSHVATTFFNSDGPEKQREGQLCTHCETASAECTYGGVIKRSRPTKRYVEYLEQRIAHAERLLRQHCPEVDLMQELGALTAARLLGEPDNWPDASSSSDEDHCAYTLLVDGPRDDFETGFIGESSMFDILLATVESKLQNPNGSDTWANLESVKRSGFWQLPPHELRGTSLDERGFHPRLPPPEDQRKQIDAYFDKFNTRCPILHRALFEQQLRDPAYKYNKHFLAIIILVCALGERTLSPADCQASKPSGWSYFEQVEPFLRVPTPGVPCLFDIQIWLLSASYLSTTADPGSAPWMLVGMALRMLIYLGAHRAMTYKDEPNLVDELWKRTFWCAVVIDRTVSSALGQPSGTLEETLDVELPLDVDDDLWDISNPTEHYPLKRPQDCGQPCSISFFTQWIRLSSILAITMRTIYSLNRSRVLMGFIGVDWEHKMIAKLDASLEAWLEGLPPHLRWDPISKDLKWLNQSAELYTTFYRIQILIYNPFMRSVPRSSAGSPSGGDNATPILSSQAVARSLTTCTKAALSCSRVLATQIQRGSHLDDHPSLAEGAFASGLILLLNLFGAKKKLATDSLYVRKMTAALRVCMNALAFIEKSWKFAGQRWDILNDLAGDLHYPLPPSLLTNDAIRPFMTSEFHQTAPTEGDFRRSTIFPAIPTEQTTGPYLPFDESFYASEPPFLGLANSAPMDGPAVPAADDWLFNFDNVPNNLELLLANHVPTLAGPQELQGFAQTADLSGTFWDDWGLRF